MQIVSVPSAHGRITVFHPVVLRLETTKTTRKVVSNSCFQSSEGSAWRRYFSCRLPLVFGPPPINRRFPKRCTVLFFWNGAFQCCQCGSVAGGRGATTRHNDVKRSSKPYTFDKPSAVTGGRTTFHVCFQVAEPLQ